MDANELALGKVMRIMVTMAATTVGKSDMYLMFPCEEHSTIMAANAIDHNTTTINKPVPIVAIIFLGKKYTNIGVKIKTFLKSKTFLY